MTSPAKVGDAPRAAADASGTKSKATFRLWRGAGTEGALKDGDG